MYNYATSIYCISDFILSLDKQSIMCQNLEDNQKLITFMFQQSFFTDNINNLFSVAHPSAYTPFALERNEESLEGMY